MLRIVQSCLISRSLNFNAATGTNVPVHRSDCQGAFPSNTILTALQATMDLGLRV